MPSTPQHPPATPAPERTRILPMRDAILTFAGVCAVLGLLLWLTSELVERRLHTQLESQLLRTAQMVSSMLDTHEQAADRPGNVEPEDERILLMLQQLLRTNTDLADAYTVADDGHRLHVVLDAGGRRNLDDLVVPAAALEAMLGGGPSTSAPHAIEGIKFVSVFAPRFAADGTVAGAVGLDVPETYFTEARAGVGPIWVVCCALLLVACLAAAVVHRLRSAVRVAMSGHETRLAALEANMSRTAQAKDQAASVLATMSHELRTPLTAILGFTDLLLDPEDDLAVLRSHAQTIRRNGQHLLNVLNDVLDISKLESGTLHVERAPFDPVQVGQDVVDLLEPRAREKHVDLAFWAGPEAEEPTSQPSRGMPALVNGDAFRVRQILINLVANAVKFTEEGSVTLSTRYDHERHELAFEVTDTGVGIEADQLPALFEPFHQADASSARRSKGAGLGLAISKRLALHLGGDIDVESRPALGSTFTLRIPAEPSGHAETEAAPAVRAGFEAWKPRPSWRILLVEDTLEHQKLFFACLRRAGHSVDVCDNGQRALHKVRESEYRREPYTIVLLDLYLPEQDGLTTAREMRAHHYRGPILAITADTSAETRELCLAAGCDDVYAKPLERTSLLMALSRLVRGASAGAA